MAMQDASDFREKHKQSGFDSGLNLLFLAAFPLVLWLFQGSAAVLVTAILELVLLSFALRLISSGHAIHNEYNAAKAAQRPRLPRKILGSALIGLVVMILAGHQFPTLLMPFLTGLAATGLSIAAFGLDPLKDKGMNDPTILARIEADTQLEIAEMNLANATHRIAGLGDADLTRRTEAAQTLVLRVLRSFATEPEQLKRLQKPASKFIDILAGEVHRLEDSWESEEYLFARRRFVAKLDVLTETFETHARKGGEKFGRDAYDLEADLLLDKMRQESAA